MSSRAAMDNIKNRIMVDSPTAPRYKGVFDAYRQTWRETYDPSKGLGANSLARVRNFYKVSETTTMFAAAITRNTAAEARSSDEEKVQTKLTPGLRPSRAPRLPDERGGAGRVGDDDALGNKVKSSE